MKKLYAIILFAFVCIIANAQTWQWTRSYGNYGVTNTEIGNCISTDAKGNAYVVGGSYTTYTVTSTTTESIIDVIKYDASGNLRWSKNFGSGLKEIANKGLSICTDVNSNSYVTGYFCDSAIAFGNIILKNTGTMNQYYGCSPNIFIAKFDSLGNVLWAKSAGIANINLNAQGNGISTDANGNSYVTGFFQGSDSIKFGNITLKAANANGSFFIVKYDPSGNVVWAKCSGGTTRGSVVGRGSSGKSISVAANGYIYAAGTYSSDTIAFDNNTLYNAYPYQRIFIVKYDASGNAIWAQQSSYWNTITPNPPHISNLSICADASGNAYITGNYSNISIIFGNDTLKNKDNSGSSDDFFLVKYAASGNVISTKSYGEWSNSSYSNDYPTGISVDVNNNIYLTGSSQGGIDFGNSNYSNNGTWIVNFDASGNFIWTTAVNALTNSISSIANGSVYVTGQSSANIFTGKLRGSFSINTAQTNPICYMGKGSAQVTPVGGHAPYTYSWTTSPVQTTALATGLSPGTYTATVTDSSNLVASAIFTITSSFLITDSVINCTSGGNDGAIYLTITGGSGSFLYHWNNGATTENISGLAGGNYLLTLTDVTCGDTVLYPETVDCVTGITNYNLQREITVSPNPTSGVFTLDVGGQTTEVKEITIYDLLGEKIYSSVVSPQSSVIDLSEAPNGIYFLQLKTDQETTVKKIVLNK